MVSVGQACLLENDSRPLEAAGRWSPRRDLPGQVGPNRAGVDLRGVRAGGPEPHAVELADDGHQSARPEVRVQLEQRGERTPVSDRLPVLLAFGTLHRMKAMANILKRWIALDAALTFGGLAVVPFAKRLKSERRCAVICTHLAHWQQMFVRRIDDGTYMHFYEGVLAAIYVQPPWHVKCADSLAL